MNEYNFVIQNEFELLPEDACQLFGRIGETFDQIDPPLVYLPADTTWPDILVDRLHIFPTRGQCRNAGWINIPDGFTDKVIGKMKTRITIYKPFFWEDKEKK